MNDNPWELTDEVRNKYTPIIKQMIEDIESNTSKDVLQFNLTGEQLNPSTLGTLLEELGYEEDDMDVNGWEYDFFIDFSKEGYKQLIVSGTGITFALYLGEAEIDN